MIDSTIEGSDYRPWLLSFLTFLRSIGQESRQQITHYFTLHLPSSTSLPAKVRGETFYFPRFITRRPGINLLVLPLNDKAGIPKNPTDGPAYADHVPYRVLLP